MIDDLPRILYFVVMGIVAVGWLALIFFPRNRFANFWFSGLIVPLVLYAVYMYLLITFWFRPPAAEFTQFATLPGVYKMFANPGLLLVAWLNIITTDLVAGAWMTRKAAQIRMPYVFLLPCLIVTFVFVGFGFSLFAMFVAIGRGWSEVAKFESQPPTNSSPVSAQPAVLRSA
jgi:hypothetical protein